MDARSLVDYEYSDEDQIRHVIPAGATVQITHVYAEDDLVAGRVGAEFALYTYHQVVPLPQLTGLTYPLTA